MFTLVSCDIMYVGLGYQYFDRIKAIFFPEDGGSMFVYMYSVSLAVQQPRGTKTTCSSSQLLELELYYKCRYYSAVKDSTKF
jgi:hypothetical protein